MKVDMGWRICTLIKEPGDPRFGTESRLLYHAKKVLNAQGRSFIKKLMWKDGHLVSDDQHYLIERSTGIAIYSHFWALRGAEEDFNQDGKVCLTISRPEE